MAMPTGGAQGGPGAGQQKRELAYSEIPPDKLDEIVNKVRHMVEAGLGWKRIKRELEGQGIYLSDAAVRKIVTDVQKQLAREKEGKSSGKEGEGGGGPSELPSVADLLRDRAPEIRMQGDLSQATVQQKVESTCNPQGGMTPSCVSQPMAQPMVSSQGHNLAMIQGASMQCDPASIQGPIQVQQLALEEQDTVESAPEDRVEDLPIVVTELEGEGDRKVLAFDVGGKRIAISYTVQRIPPEERRPVKSYVVRAMEIAKRVILNPKVLMYYEYAKSKGYGGDLSQFLCDCVTFLFEKVFGVKLVVERVVRG